MTSKGVSSSGERAVEPIPTRAWHSSNLLRALVVVALVPVVLRCSFECINQVAGTKLPVLPDTSLTVCFTLFSLGHAICALGPKRACSFFAICVVDCFCFEAVGVRTALYGRYHYGMMLGPTLAGVPVLIPFAWFMMVYPSWCIAQVVLAGGRDQRSLRRVFAITFVAAMVMTAWDAAMDPMMSAHGNWIWEQHGMYFGVPPRNFGGWLATTATLYLLTELLFRATRADARRLPVWFAALPVLAYAFVALARVFITEPPPIRVFAFFSMGLISTIALARVLLCTESSSILTSMEADAVDRAACKKRNAHSMADRSLRN